MLHIKEKKIVWLEFAIIIIGVLCTQTYGEASVEAFDVKTFATKQVLGILNIVEQLATPDSNLRFALAISELLIKEKLLFHQLTTAQKNFFDYILHKIVSLKHRHNSTEFGAQQNIFDNIFQLNVLFRNSTLKSGLINVHLPYKALAVLYDDVATIGIPTRAQSDACLLAIVSMDYKVCLLPSSCLHIFTTNTCAYGYQRTHQLLLLYVFLHHKCAAFYGSQAVWEEAARDKCSEISREQNAIRLRGLEPRYYDLFLEQMLVCGSFFGHMEFLNLPNIKETSMWSYTGSCNCTNEQQLQPMYCLCHNHIDSVALAFYLSVLTLLY